MKDKLIKDVLYLVDKLFYFTAKFRGKSQIKTQNWEQISFWWTTASHNWILENILGNILGYTGVFFVIRVVTLNNKSKSPTAIQPKIDIWISFTSLEPEKQCPAIVLTLDGEVKDAIFELSTFTITLTDRVSKIIEHLKKLHKKDELTEKYNAKEWMWGWMFIRKSLSYTLSQVFAITLKAFL